MGRGYHRLYYRDENGVRHAVGTVSDSQYNQMRKNANDAITQRRDSGQGNTPTIKLSGNNKNTTNTNPYENMSKEQIQSLRNITVGQFDQMSSQQQTWYRQALEQRQREENTYTEEQLESMNAAAWYAGDNYATDPKNWSSAAAERFADRHGYYVKEREQERQKVRENLSKMSSSTKELLNDVSYALTNYTGRRATPFYHERALNIIAKELGIKSDKYWELPELIEKATGYSMTRAR
ncbi:MAG: hypothetical protein IJI57_04565 [Flexilinea sp.]|nr:hypothetical protein [Flexilinea sp.]